MSTRNFSELQNFPRLRKTFDGFLLRLSVSLVSKMLFLVGLLSVLICYVLRVHSASSFFSPESSNISTKFDIKFVIIKIMVSFKENLMNRLSS